MNIYPLRKHFSWCIYYEAEMFMQINVHKGNAMSYKVHLTHDNFLISQNTIAATHAALDVSPMNKNFMKILGDKYSDLASKEKNKEMREFYSKKSEWYSNDSK